MREGGGEMKPKKDHYICEDDLGDEYCSNTGCKECFGSDYNGEPNGYGCVGRDKFIEDNEGLILDFEAAYFLQTEKLKKLLDKVLGILEKQSYREIFKECDVMCRRITKEIEKLKEEE